MSLGPKEACSAADDCLGSSISGEMVKKKGTVCPGAHLDEVSSQIEAPAFAQEQAYGQLIGKSLKRIAEVQKRQEKAKKLPHNALQERFAQSPSVLPESYDKGAVINDKT